jgi:hypothetical protein
VPVTVGRVALVAEPRIVVEARGVDLVIRQRLLERRRDLLCPSYVYGLSKSVWWITTVNDTLRRNYKVEYDQAPGLMSPSPTDTLDGLRSVRNRVGHDVDLVTFIEPVASRADPGDGRITAWAWRSVPPPVQGGGGRNRPREQQRAEQLHEAYERALPGQNVWQSFNIAAGFFGQVARIINGEIKGTNAT